MNSEILSELVGAVFTILAFAVLAQWMRHKSYLGDRDLPALTALIVDYIFPMFIFAALARATLTWQEVVMPATMASVILICLALAWIVARFLPLTRKQKGTFLIGCTFGSTSFVGIPIIQQVMADKPSATVDAVISYEFGSSLLLITLGIAIVRHFGSDENGSVRRHLLDFFRTPMFIAMVFGVVWSVGDLPISGFVPNIIFNFCEVAGKALPLLAGLSLGLMIKPVAIRKVIWIFIAVVVIKMIIQPLLMMTATHHVALDAVATEVLVIFASTPCAAMVAVFSQRYGCDGELGTALVIGTLILSAVTLPISLALWTSIGA